MKKYFLLCFIVLFSCSKFKSEHPHSHFQGVTMGTTYSVKVVKPLASGEIADHEQLQTRIDNLLQEVNRQMSTFRPGSELSQFNQSQKTDWFPVSADLLDVITSALSIADLSNGAFDISVGPLVNLWGFGPEKKVLRIPEDDAILKRMQIIGFEKLSVRRNPPAIKKSISALYCDLSAIAKGFGVDKISRYLESLGFENYMVEVGGEVRAKGHNRKGLVWRIGVRAPSGTSEIQKIVEIKDCAIATSGDYFNYFEENNVRYSHTIDPRTGRPITHKLASVTVIHHSCAMADGLATAINVLGPDMGYDFALTQGFAVFMIVKSDEGFFEKMTPDFEKYISKFK